MLRPTVEPSFPGVKTKKSMLRPIVELSFPGVEGTKQIILPMKEGIGRKEFSPGNLYMSRHMFSVVSTNKKKNSVTLEIKEDSNYVFVVTTNSGDDSVTFIVTTNQCAKEFLDARAEDEPHIKKPCQNVTMAKSVTVFCAKKMQSTFSLGWMFHEPSNEWRSCILPSAAVDSTSGPLPTDSETFFTLRFVGLEQDEIPQAVECPENGAGGVSDRGKENDPENDAAEGDDENDASEDDDDGNDAAEDDDENDASEDDDDDATICGEGINSDDEDFIEDASFSGDEQILCKEPESGASSDDDGNPEIRTLVKEPVREDDQEALIKAADGVAVDVDPTLKTTLQQSARGKDLLVNVIQAYCTPSIHLTANKTGFSFTENDLANIGEMLRSLDPATDSSWDVESMVKDDVWIKGNIDSIRENYLNYLAWKTAVSESGCTEERREELNIEIEGFETFMEEQRRVILEALSESFGKHQVPKGTPCFLLVPPTDLDSAFDPIVVVIRGEVVGYDPETRQTTIRLFNCKEDPRRVFLPDCNVFFSEESANAAVRNSPGNRRFALELKAKRTKRARRDTV